MYSTHRSNWRAVARNRMRAFRQICTLHDTDSNLKNDVCWQVDYSPAKHNDIQFLYCLLLPLKPFLRSNENLT